MSITVVIPNYNNAPFVETCIRSVFNQGIAGISCIVIDNGSTDGSVALLKNIMPSYPFDLIQVNENEGVSFARNLGLDKAKTDYVAFLDADDYWEPTHLKPLLAHLATNPATFVFSNHYRLKGDEKGAREIPKNYSLSLESAIVEDRLSFCAVVFRVAALRGIDGFDESLQYGEDGDLIFRLLNKGGTCRFIDQLTVAYRQHATNAMANRSPLVAANNLEALVKKAKLLGNPIQYKAAIAKRLATIRWYMRESRSFLMWFQYYQKGTMLLGFSWLARQFKNVLVDLRCITRP